MAHGCPAQPARGPESLFGSGSAALGQVEETTQGRDHSLGVFEVTTTADAPDADPADGVCASTLPGGPCTLRAAVQTANASPGFDDIRIDPSLLNTNEECSSTVFPLTVSGIDEDAAATGDLDVTEALRLWANAGACGISVDGGNNYNWQRVELPGTVCGNGSQYKFWYYDSPTSNNMVISFEGGVPGTVALNLKW